MNVRALVGAIAMAVMLAACVSLAPGADKVRLTNNGSDVSSCTAVGNVKVPPADSTGDVPIFEASKEFRNQVVGLGGNTGLVTYGLFDIPSEGIAYRCP